MGGRPSAGAHIASISGRRSRSRRGGELLVQTSRQKLVLNRHRLRRAVSFRRAAGRQRPENKALTGNFDDFGQRALNLDDPAHDFTTAHSYERCYLTTVPAKSQRRTWRELWNETSEWAL